MSDTVDYDKVCYRTEQQEESVPLRHLKTGQIGYSIGCTKSGETIQVRLGDGELDTWSRDECTEDVSEATSLLK